MLNLNKIDLAGRQFGLLRVLRIYQIKDGIVWWKCECACGSIVAVKANDLRVVNDCGCLGEYAEDIIVIKKSDVMYAALQDIKSDEAYGLGLDDNIDYGKILQPTKPSRGLRTNKSISAKSKTVKTVNKSATKSAKVNIEDMVGHKFGKLTVLEYVGVKNDYKMFKCRCDCGKEVIVKGTYLRTGKRTMCHANTCPLRNK